METLPVFCERGVTMSSKTLRCERVPDDSQRYTVQVSLLLSEGPLDRKRLRFQGEGDGEDRVSLLLLQELMKIPGLQSVEIDRYIIRLQKGSMFDWGKILPRVKQAVKRFIEVDRLFEKSVHEACNPKVSGKETRSSPPSPKHKDEEGP